jgi:hypothetical protein
VNLDPEFRAKFNRSPCPICESVEGCDHTVFERLLALDDTAYRDRMRAEDPLYQRQLQLRAHFNASGRTEP